MRNLTAGALTEIGKKLGTEPINILGIKWTDTGNIIEYADKEISGIGGKILELSSLDAVIKITDSSDTATFDVVLDDTDGSIKAIMDAYDIHKRPCYLYQHFVGMAITDKFLLFKGEIASPIVWSESERTVSFTVISRLEDKEVGFSPEQGQFGFITEELAGKPWPLAFGSCLHIPAIKIREAPVGVLKTPIGIVDPLLYVQQRELSARKLFLEQQIAWFSLSLQFAEQLAPPSQTVLDNYLNTVIDEDKKRRDLLAKIADLKDKDDEIVRESDKTARDLLRKDRKQIITDIITLATDLNIIRNSKGTFKSQKEAAEYEQRVRQALSLKVADLVNEHLQVAALLLEVNNAITDQLAYQVTSFEVIDGDKFPQNTTIDLIINDMRIRGSFSGTTFTVTVWGLPKYTQVQIAARKSTRIDAFWLVDPSLALKDMYCWLNNGMVVKINEQVSDMCTIDLVENSNTDLGSPSGSNTIPRRTAILPANQAKLTAGGADPINKEELEIITALENLINFESTITIPNILPETNRYGQTGFDVTNPIVEVAPVMLAKWMANLSLDDVEELPDSEFWFADSGSTIYLADNYEQTYVASILPSTIKAVSAFRTINNVERLVTVPSTYYKKFQNHSLGGISITAIVLKQPLSWYEGEQWEDSDLFISLQSSIGPNTVDILEYLITTYTTMTFDTTSFTAVKAKLTNYPSHFTLTERKNVLIALQEIAWQARCAIWLKNDVFYLKYLSEDPTSAATITLSDIEHQSLQIGFTETEDLVTKFVANWRKNYYASEPNQLILRHNVNKYGTLERSFDFYIYNIQSLVEKSATFWLIRYANTWKRVTFNTFLTNLRLETFDTITLNLGDVASSPVKAIIQKADYDSANHTIAIECWVPVKAGTLAPYDLAFPSSVSVTRVFPTVEEVITGSAGGGPPGSTVTGSINPSTSFTPTSTRPRDYGREFNADATDVAPPNPLTGFLEVGNQIIPQKSRKLNQNLKPKNQIDELEALNLTDRECFIGMITEDLGSNDYKVVVSTNGAYVIAGFMKPWLNYFIEPGHPAVVVQDYENEKFLLFTQMRRDWTKDFKIRTVEDDTLICEDLDTLDEIVLAKPWSLRKSTYDNKTINTILYTHESEAIRKAVGVQTNFEKYSLYNVGDIISGIQMPFAIMDDPNAAPVFWLDVNADGRAWELVRELAGKIGGLGVITGPGIQVPVEIYSPDFIIKANETIQARLDFFQSGLLIWKDSRVIVRKLDTISAHEELWEVVKILQPATFIDFVLTSDLAQTDSTADVILLDWDGGEDPKYFGIASAAGQMIVFNDNSWEGDAGGTGQARYTDDGTYTIIVLECKATGT